MCVSMSGSPTEFGDGRPDLNTIKEMRRNHPSGWLQLAKDPARALLIDAILDAPPNYEFSPPEIGPRAGISDQSVRNHIDTLARIGIVEPIGDSRYVVLDRGRVMKELKELNSAVTAVRSGMSTPEEDFTHPSKLMDNSASPDTSDELIDIPEERARPPS